MKPIKKINANEEYVIFEIMKRLLDSQGPQNDHKPSSNLGIIFAIIIGSILCIFGTILVCLGLSGSVEWAFQAGSLSSKIINASPGMLFCLMGMLILWIYKPGT